MDQKDKNSIIITFTLSKSLPVQGLWEQGLMMSRMFVASLNIATNGFFWWNIKRDPAKYYREIQDLENDAFVSLELNPKLEINWKAKRWVLREVDLSLTGMVFAYTASCNSRNEMDHLNRYVRGLCILAKNDVHLRLEVNAFEEFYETLKMAMSKNNDWDGTTELGEAFIKATAWRYPESSAEMAQAFMLASRLNKGEIVGVDLTAVYAMKLYCETYLLTLALQDVEKRTGKKVQVDWDDGDN